jgi:6-phosphofructokinase 1
MPLEAALKERLASTQTTERDASGNIRYSDTGLFLRDRIKAHFSQRGRKVGLTCLDSSDTMRSLPAKARNAAFCLLLGPNAVQAGMAGKTDMVADNWNNRGVPVPIAMAGSPRKKLDPGGWIWTSVLALTRAAPSAFWNGGMPQAGPKIHLTGIPPLDKEETGT